MNGKAEKTIGEALEHVGRKKGRNLSIFRCFRILALVTFLFIEHHKEKRKKRLLRS